MRKRPHSSAGFTWIEALVTIAVVAMLTAVIVPVVGRFLQDTQKLRAQEDCEMIAQAIERFYQDVGLWPTFGSMGMPEEVYSLITGNNTDAANNYGFTAGGSNTLKWLTGGTLDTGKFDYLDNHLTKNSPKGQTNYIYPTTTTAQFCWRGPYLPKINTDPWGRPYLVTLVAPLAQRVTDANGDVYSYSRWVVSAGPNGVIDTVWHPTAATNQRRNRMGGDDIGARIDMEVD